MDRTTRTVTLSHQAAKDAVERGAALLDKKFPGWVDKIDLGHLAMVSCTDCVGGQIAGYYPSAMETMGLELEDQRILGFEASHYYTYGDLDTAWKDLIVRRRAVAELKPPQEKAVVDTQKKKTTHQEVADILDRAGVVWVLGQVIEFLDDRATILSKASAVGKGSSLERDASVRASEMRAVIAKLEQAQTESAKYNV